MIDTLSMEEKEELLRIVKKELDLFLNNTIHASEINKSPETPMKAYVRQAKINVLLRKQEEEK
ncbi:MAG TPA: hypothetical protein PLM50_08675 [Rectinema sp.]|nr:hypothetical protein [Rectinema sp.]